jgi:hypothetical protein
MVFAPSAQRGPSLARPVIALVMLWRCLVVELATRAPIDYAAVAMVTAILRQLMEMNG